jgi:hypothetical protein
MNLKPKKILGSQAPTLLGSRSQAHMLATLRAHTELEFDMLGVHGKLVKYVVHSPKRKK